MSAMRTVSWTVDAASARLRLDAFLAAQLHWRSRRWVTSRLEHGAIRVNGRAAKKAQRVAIGDTVVLTVAEAEHPPADEAPIALRVLFQDDDLVVVDKPAQLPVHPSSTCLHRNLLVRLRQHLGDTRGATSIIHRLDRNTTGVIAFARRAELVPFFMQQFERRTVRKRYVAIVHGEPADSGRIDAPLLIRPAMPVVVDGRGKPSHTAWTVIDRAPALAMLDVALHTGRKHQIRVHLSSIGHPIVFDDIYGRVHERALWPPPMEAEHRPQLHAAQLQLDHTDGRRLVFDAPVPASMTATWQMLGCPK